MISLRRLLTVTRKEFRHIIRDVRTFFLVTVAPAFLLVTLSYVFSFDVERVDVALCDLDHSPLSRELIASLTADGDVNVITYVQRIEQIESLFVHSHVDLALVIPHGFADAMLSGDVAEVQSIVDGADAITANQSAGIVERRVVAFEAAVRQRMAPRLTDSLDVRLDVSSRAWYNEGLKSLVSMVPGMMAVILCMPALALALALTREKEMGSFETLIATPVRGTEYLLGKLLAYELSGIVSAILAWLVATLWFHVPFRGRVLTYLLLAADYLLASLGVSLVIANFVRNQQTAMFLILIVFFVPSFFITGLILPVANNSFSQIVAFILPTTHFITISRGVFLKGLEVGDLGQTAVILLGDGLLCLVFSLALFEKKLG